MVWRSVSGGLISWAQFFKSNPVGISDHGLDQILDMGFSKQKMDSKLRSAHVI